MGGLAQLARAAGHQVTGADAHVYPPMSDQLAAAGIAVHEGYDPAQLDPAPDVVVVGNAMSRGNPAVEAMLERGLPYTSGPQWLAEHLLPGRWVLAVAGTHGKTTTASMLAWVLDHAGLAPGFLIGGVPRNFGVSARAGDGPFFVIEADEYDTAFFDKRSKFLHYRPRTLVLNNLEFDHADIFADLGQIQRQFAHLLRTVPGTGLLILPAGDVALQGVLAQGCWTPQETFAGPLSVASTVVLDAAATASDAAASVVHPDATPGAAAAEGAGRPCWQAELLHADGSRFAVWCGGQRVGEVCWELQGGHNVHNALAALAAARHAGVPPALGCEALSGFVGVKRRMELRGSVGGVRVFDDFAHHPTAIATTLQGARARLQQEGRRGRLIAVLEPRSNTMRLGSHVAELAAALDPADRVLLYRPPGLGWDPAAVLGGLGDRLALYTDTAALVRELAALARPGDDLVVMSNGGFDNLHARLLVALGEIGREIGRAAAGAPAGDDPGAAGNAGATAAAAVPEIKAGTRSSQSAAGATAEAASEAMARHSSSRGAST